MFVSIVVPCYRSARTLPELVERLEACMPQVADGYEVLLVVDGSPDNTWTVADRLASTHTGVRAIRLSRNYGQHSALIAGIRAARHEVVVTMDDDLQHRPEEIGKLLEALTDEVDLVYGKPHEEEHGFLRSFASRSVKASMARLIGVAHARDISSFRAFRTFLRDGFEQIQGPHGFVDVALSWGTTRVAAVHLQMDKRTDGESGYTIKTLIRYAINMIVGYSAKPLRLVTYLGLVVGFAGMVLLANALWAYYGSAEDVEGWTSLASMVAIFSSAQLVGIGVLGEYLGRVHAQGMGKPTYVIREISEAGTTAPQPLPGQPRHRASRQTAAAG